MALHPRPAPQARDDLVLRSVEFQRALAVTVVVFHNGGDQDPGWAAVGASRDQEGRQEEDEGGLQQGRLRRGHDDASVVKDDLIRQTSSRAKFIAYRITIHN